jgi:cob(I)alamin adenosyltransferase
VRRVPRFKIYTKTGDEGESSLYNGQRKPKSDGVFAALGDIDEVNACIGAATEHCKTGPGESGLRVATQLGEIQSRLLDVGSAIATPLDTSSERKVAVVAFDESASDKLEGWIDEMDADLPALRAFILPSGGLAAAQLHVARAVCRRAERSVVSLGTESVSQSVRIYLNRLSDYLFTAARFVAKGAGEPETTYKKNR